VGDLQTTWHRTRTRTLPPDLGWLPPQPGPRDPACDFFTATALNGETYYVFAVIEHASRRVRVLGATAHPTAEWTTQTARNLITNLQGTGTTVKYLIRDRDSKYTRAFDAVFRSEGIGILTTGIRIPRMNSIMERWVQTCRHKLLDRTLIWNQALWGAKTRFGYLDLRLRGWSMLE
jgi:hypothetical protein